MLRHKTVSMVMPYIYLLDEHKKKGIQLLDGLWFRKEIQSPRGDRLAFPAENGQEQI